MLSAEQVKTFETQGYLVVEDLLEPDVRERVKQEYFELMETLYAGWREEGLLNGGGARDFWGQLDAANRAGIDWFQPMDISLPGEECAVDTPMHFGPAVFDMVTSARVLDVVETLIGSEITSNPIQHVRIKPPRREMADDEVRAHVVATDWHQDQGVTLPEADQTTFVTVWLAITDATVENGCLQVGAGQYSEMLPHCPKKQTAIADGHIPEEAVPLPVKAGGAVLFHPLTPHSSLENKSDGFRWSFDLRYNVAGQPTGRSHFPEFIARSRSHPERELKDWREWKSMWEDARQRLSARPHIDQHRWDSSSPYCA